MGSGAQAAEGTWACSVGVSALLPYWGLIGLGLLIHSGLQGFTSRAMKWECWAFARVRIENSSVCVIEIQCLLSIVFRFVSVPCQFASVL